MIVFVVLVVDLDSIHLSKLHSHLVKISHRQDCHEWLVVQVGVEEERVVVVVVTVALCTHKYILVVR